MNMFAKIPVLKLFRPLASDLSDEEDHHTTRYREPYPGICHYVMAPALSNQFSAIVDQVMMKEAIIFCVSSQSWK